MPCDAATLVRIHRVRTLQLTLARAEESRARDLVDSEAALEQRIGALAAAVAPAPGTLAGLGLGAAAQYRDRLHQSAAAVAGRVTRAEQAAATSAAATRAARQDQGAVEKLIARARRDEASVERRSLEALPFVAGKRHETC